MKFKFFCFLLYRYLLSSTLMPVYGVAVGVFAFVVVLSVMSGFVENIKSEIIKLTPHIQIISTQPGQDIPADQDLIPQIKALEPTQIAHISAFQSGDGILQSDTQATLITLEGVDPKNSPNVVDISNFLVVGRGLSALDQSEQFPAVIIGRDLALQLNLNLDDVTTLVSVLFDEGFAPVQMPVIVSGIYDTGRAYLDSKLIYISLTNANRFFNSEKMWKGLQLKLTDPFHPDDVVQRLNHFFQTNHLNLIAEPWTKKNSALLKALLFEHIGMLIVMTMIILVGCFSITISLLLSLYRKTRELAILRGLGLTQTDLSKLYLGQGCVIGCAGVVIGLICGLFTLYVAHNYQIPFLTNLYSSGPLPMKINIFDIFLVTMGSILLATIAALWPAYAVRRLNVVDVLAIRQ